MGGVEGTMGDVESEEGAGRQNATSAVATA